jgi:hypothetical protein
VSLPDSGGYFPAKFRWCSDTPDQRPMPPNRDRTM